MQGFKSLKNVFNECKRLQELVWECYRIDDTGFIYRFHDCNAFHEL